MSNKKIIKTCKLKIVWFGKYGRKISWMVKIYRKCGRKISWKVHNIPFFSLFDLLFSIISISFHYSTWDFFHIFHIFSLCWRVKRHGKYGGNPRLNSEKIWKVWKKSKSNKEKTGKLWKKDKLNSEMFWKLRKKSKDLLFSIISISFHYSTWDFFHIYHIFSLFNLYLLHKFHIFTIRLTIQ
jgi:hypothetical protein